MPDVSTFNLSGASIKVKDATARQQLSNALSTAQGAQTAANKATETANTAKSAADKAQKTADTASTTASQALDKAKSIENLSRVEVSYTDSTETITITVGTHNN